MVLDVEYIPGVVGNAAATAGNGAGMAALPAGLAAGRGGNGSSAGGRMTPALWTHSAVRAVLKASAVFGFGGMGILVVGTRTHLPLDAWCAVEAKERVCWLVQRGGRQCCFSSMVLRQVSMRCAAIETAVSGSKTPDKVLAEKCNTAFNVYLMVHKWGLDRVRESCSETILHHDDLSRILDKLGLSGYGCFGEVVADSVPRFFRDDGGRFFGIVFYISIYPGVLLTMMVVSRKTSFSVINRNVFVAMVIASRNSFFHIQSLGVFSRRM